MNESITVTFDTQWQAEPSDGSTCQACGDVAWLTHSRLVLKAGNTIITLPLVVCQSCTNALEITPTPHDSV